MVGRLSRDVVKMGDEERDRFKILRKEAEILSEVSSFFAGELGCEVLVFPEDDENRDDPAGKSNASTPLKPAIFME